MIRIIELTNLICKDVCIKLNIDPNINNDMQKIPYFVINSCWSELLIIEFKNFKKVELCKMSGLINIDINGTIERYPKLSNIVEINPRKKKSKYFIFFWL